jgi:hypothetical protein
MVKLPLCLISYVLFHEDILWSGGTAQPFFTSALDVGQWSASRPCHFIAEERAPGAHWIGDWSGRYAKEKNIDPVGNRTRPSSP